MDPKQQQIERQMELNRREMQRKSLDVFRVYNPLDSTFRFMYDGFWHEVKAKSTKDMPRYLARHYLKKISDKIIGDEMLTKGEELLKLREKQFGKSFIDKYEENKEVWDKVPRLDDPDLVKKVTETVILGLVEEYGMDMPEPEREASGPADLRPAHEQAFDAVDKRITPEVEKPKKTTYPINKKSDMLSVKEVTNDPDNQG